ncbi:MAG: response regulator receiver protein [Chloroflexales bacterium]|nr:response regulator receiver protein [Chloroflexales bacterium]
MSPLQGPDAAGRLHITLFGSMRISRGASERELPIARSGKALLAYLLLQRHRMVSRELLSELFWQTQTRSQARSCLSTTLWRLRDVLEPKGVERGTYVISTSSGELSFNWQSEHWLDIAAFQSRAERFLAQPPEALDSAGARQMTQSLGLYSSDLLEGIYDDWALRERERLRALHSACLARLMAYYRDQGAYEQSLEFGRQILYADPLREEIHRELMRLYVAAGQRAAAVRQYESCRAILAEELAIAPMEETQTLYRQIVEGAALARSDPDLHLPDGVLERLKLALLDYERSRAQLEEVIAKALGSPDTA